MLIFKILVLCLVGCSFARTNKVESQTLEEVSKFEVIRQRLLTTPLFFLVLFITAAIATSMLPFTYHLGFYFGRWFVAPAFHWVFTNT